MRLKIVLLTALCVIASISDAKIKMPNIFSDNMVLQRDKPIHIWGWGEVNEKIEIEFRGQKVKTAVSKDGRWETYLKKSAFGGPYILTIKGKDSKIIYNNVMIGDVWLCSGQSNMEMVVKRTNNAQDEIAAADYPQIRLFTVGRAMANLPNEDVEGEWEICSPSTVADFSAVGYFFGREIFLNTGIPQGLICSAWGGTVVETWTSPQMMRTITGYTSKLDEIEKIDLKTYQKNNQLKKEEYIRDIKNDKGIVDKWYNNISVYTNKMDIPKEWADTELSDMDGSVWFKTQFTLPANAIGKTGTLSLGTIDDADITWINGQEVGRTDGYDIKRIYHVPAGLLQEGINTLVVNVVDYAAGGGINGIQDQLYIEIEGIKYPLSGTWNYAISVDSRKYKYVELGPNSYPSLLYNGMIAPLVNFPIKGITWYQGESNDYDPYLYRTLFPNIINDWRAKWNELLPFYWVQLANFREADKQPSRSKWAEIREAQTMALSLPNTGQAITIDIGDAKDIHPRNKQDVGKRLALIALKNNYDKSDIIASGPIFGSMIVENNKIIISFDNASSGLFSNNKYGYITGFSIAGKDGHFVWAKANIDGNKVIVWQDDVTNPVEVRYAWGDNPDDACLYNSAGLPACPFSAKQ